MLYKNKPQYNEISNKGLPTKEDILLFLKEDEYVRNRIYNLRHGKTEKKNGHIPDNMSLLDGEKENIKNNQGERLKGYGLNSINTSINYAGKTARIRETATAIIEVIDIKEVNQQNYVSELHTIPRDVDTQGEGNANLLDLSAKCAKFINELFDILKNKKEGENIINIIHKTNFTGMNVLVNRSSGENIVLEIYGGIEENEIKEIDFSEKKESINYEKRKNLLFLSDHNVDCILPLLKKDPLFHDIISAYNNQNIQIYELQNYINYFFKKKPELFKKYLASKNEYLRIFSLANLINLKDYSTLSEIYMKNNYKLSQQEKDLLLKNNEITEVKFLITQHFIDKRDLRDNEELDIFKENGLENYYNLMKNYNENIIKKIGNIRNKSLDKRYHTQNDKKEIGGNFDLGDKKIEENCLNILDNNQTVYIEGDGGSGKSFFSVYFQEQLKKNNFIHNGILYFPIFIQLSGQGREGVEKEIKEQKKHYKDNHCQIVCFFESLDESKFCNKTGIENFLEYIEHNNLKSIINTRAGYLDTKAIDKEKSNIKKYTIKGMKDPMQYVKDFFEGDQYSINKYIEFQEKIGEKYINENALFVTILCELIQGGGEKLVLIDSKWKLFEAIVEQRISKWESEKRGGIMESDSSDEDKNEMKKEEVENRLKSLEEVAYIKNNNGGTIKKEDIKKIMKDCKNPNIQALSFLFKKNENGEYGFIHQTFENYFLLKYFVTRPEELDRLIKESKDKKEKEKEKLQLFILSSKEGFKEIMEWLLDKGYDINEKNINGDNAFMYACGNGELEVAKWLSERIENINEKNINGNNAFMRACENGELEVAKWLSERIENINEKNINGNNAFMYACANGELEVAKWLSERIENINEKNINGNNAFMYACANGELEVATWLSERIENINEKNINGNNAFMYACANGELEVAKWLSERIENINEKNIYGNNAFIYACVNGELEVAKWLSERIENINEKDINGDNAFMGACGNGELEVAKWLSERIENINEKNINGNNAFMGACGNGELEVAKWLSERIENINEKNIYGNNAFMRACGNGELEVATWLSERIENINEKNINGNNAFMLACKQGKLNLAKWLYTKITIDFNDLEKYLLISKTNGQTDLIKFLEEKIREYLK